MYYNMLFFKGMSALCNAEHCRPKGHTSVWLHPRT
jgi:hypothetical protein